jgi:hypothetical protein
VGTNWILVCRNCLIKHFGYIDTSHLPTSAELKLQESLDKNEDEDTSLIRREKGASSSCPTCKVTLGADPMKANVRSDPILQSITDKLKKFLTGSSIISEKDVQIRNDIAREMKMDDSELKDSTGTVRDSESHVFNDANSRNIIFHLLPYRAKESE